MNHTTIDPAEVDQFSRIAEEWWDPAGKFKPLHDINPVRLKYIRDHMAQHFNRDTQTPSPFNGLQLLDIGCGGGLVCEPMTRLGAAVTGLDASEKNIKTASVHAQKMKLDITYIAGSSEAHAREKAAQYDVVLALEIVEHVADIELFVRSCSQLVKPGGLLIMSTINRTLKSLAMAKIGAEYILRLLPRGTHDWRKFVKPSELAAQYSAHQIELIDISGMVLNPLKWQWHMHPRDVDVNYYMVGKK